MPSAMPSSADPSTQKGRLEIQAALVRIAYDAGQIVIAASPSRRATGAPAQNPNNPARPLNPDTKKNSVDLVTETDRAVEKMVNGRLKAEFPEFRFLGEESYTPGQELTAAPTFIVDPIDGTTNFVHGHPYSCISLGLALNCRPVVGVVYNPFTGVLYRAAEGCGAFVTAPEPAPSPSDSSTAQTSENPFLPATLAYKSVTRSLPLVSPPLPLPPLGSALVAVEWGSDRFGNEYNVKTDTFHRLARATTETGLHGDKPGAMVHSLRSLGSAALNICAVAAGHLDVYWESGCWAWDVCAGWCILSEAGGVMVDANPGGWSPKITGRRYMAVRAGATKAGTDSATDALPNHITPETRRLVEEFWSNVEGRYQTGSDV